MESFDYDLDGYDMIQNLSSRVLFIQNVFKSYDLIQHHQNRKIKIRRAFEMMKTNACGDSPHKFVKLRISNEQSNVSKRNIKNKSGWSSSLSKANQIDGVANKTYGSTQCRNIGSQATTNLMNAESQAFAPQLTNIGSQVYPPQQQSAAVQAHFSVQRNSTGNQWSEQYKSLVPSQHSRNPSISLHQTMGTYKSTHSQNQPYNSKLSDRHQSVLDKFENATHEDLKSKSYYTKESLEENIQQVQQQKQALELNGVPYITDLLDNVRTNGDQNQLSMAYQLQQAQFELTNYRGFLDELKDQTILRIENLTQIEISLAERELASTQAGRQYLGNINQFSTATNPFQPSQTLQEGEFGTQGNVIQKDNFSLMMNEFENYRSQTEAYLISAQVQIQSKRNHVDNLAKDIENKRIEVNDLYKRQMEFPLTCLQPNHDGITWYIESMEQIEHDDLEQIDIFKNLNQDQNEKDQEFKLYVKQPESINFMNKVDKLAFQYQNYGHQLSEEEFRNMMMNKARSILRLEFEAMKNKAKNKIVLTDLINKKYILDEMDQHFQEKVNERVISVELQRYLSSEMMELGKRQEAFMEVIKNVQTNYGQMVQELNVEMPFRKSEPAIRSTNHYNGNTTNASDLWMKSKNLNQQLAKMIKQNHEDQNQQDNKIKLHSKGNSLIDSLNSSMKLQLQIAKVSIDIDRFDEPPQIQQNYQATMTPQFLYNRFLNKDTWDGQMPNYTQRVSILKDMDQRMSAITESQQEENQQVQQNINAKLDNAHAELRNNLLLNHNISKQSIENFDKMMSATKTETYPQKMGERNVSFGTEDLEKIDLEIDILEENKYRIQAEEQHNNSPVAFQIKTLQSMMGSIDTYNSQESRFSQRQDNKAYALNQNQSFAINPPQVSQYNDLAGNPIPQPDSLSPSRLPISHPPEDSEFWIKEYERQLQAFNSQNKTSYDQNSGDFNDQAVSKFFLNQRTIGKLSLQSQSQTWDEENEHVMEQQRFAQQLQLINNPSPTGSILQQFNPSPVAQMPIQRKSTLKVPDRYFKRDSSGQTLQQHSELEQIQELEEPLPTDRNNNQNEDEILDNSPSPNLNRRSRNRSPIRYNQTIRTYSSKSHSKLSKKSKSSTSPIRQPDMNFGNAPSPVIGKKLSLGSKKESLQFSRKSPNSSLKKRRKEQTRSPQIDKEDILDENIHKTYQTQEMLDNIKQITGALTPPEFQERQLNGSDSYYEDKSIEIQEKERKLFVLQENLKLDIKYNGDLKHQLRQQLQSLQEKQEQLKMHETDMNQQKLSILIKFDKIKYLEDFYNYHKGDQKEDLKLDIEVDQNEKIEIIEKLYLNHCKKVQVEETKRYWALTTIGNLIKTLIIKKKQSPQNKLKYFLYFWKLQSMNKESQIDLKKRALILSNSNDRIFNKGVMESDDETINWNLKIQNISFNGIKDLRQMTGKQLFILSGELHNDIKAFKKFRLSKIMKQMFLNQRRRARLLTYFAFQKYKTQIYKAIMSDVFKSQEMGLPTIKMQESPTSTKVQENIKEEKISPASRKYLQDHLLDEVFASGSKSAASSVRGGVDLTLIAYIDGGLVQDSTGLTRILKNQNKVNQRKQAIIALTALSRSKRDIYYRLHVGFKVWKDAGIQESLYEMQEANALQNLEIEKLKEAHSRSLNQFVISKQELESKLQRMAVLIRQKINSEPMSHNAL